MVNINSKNINGWNEWSKYVLNELERNNSQHEIMMEKLEQIGKDIVLLKYKSSAIGFGSGVLGAAIVLIIKLLV